MSPLSSKIFPTCTLIRLSACRTPKWSFLRGFHTSNPPKVTEAIYLKNAYLFSLLAEITDVGIEHIKGQTMTRVRLNETIFHAQGGGQPNDGGTINGHPVVHIIKKTIPNCSYFEIDHFLDAKASFQCGQTVRLQIDESKRRLFMRLHTAGHLIAHIIEGAIPDLKAAKAHHFPGEARITLTGIGLKIPKKEELVELIEKQAALLIHNKAETEILWREDGQRQLKVAHFKGFPCGGTHVRNLEEIGVITIRNIKYEKEQIHIGYGVQT